MGSVHARPALDGAAEHDFNNASVASVTLTTSHPHDVVIVGVILIFGTNIKVTSVTDSEGLVYSQRTRFSACDGPAIEEWYTFAPTALSADIITVTLSSVTLAPQNGFIAWGVSGSAVSKFDDSPSFPATSAEANCSSPLSTAFSTHSRNDFIFGLIAINDGNEYHGQGFTSLASNSGSGGDFLGSMDLMYQVTTGIRSVSSASTSGQVVIMVVDAVQLAGPF